MNVIDPMTAKTLMIMGTSSSAGKSLLTAALCRCFSRRGNRVAPFKAQNMSNNASVCADGGEIGRSQALQALAAGVLPNTDMNPILLKPEGDSRSQVIVNGRPWQSLGAREYFQRKQELWPVVTGAIERLRNDYELVIIEGAGSPAELNLSGVEIVNMSVARHCGSTVLLVGDIERGGIFAQLLGTLWLLTPRDRSLIAGLIVNKFRGDLRLFDRGRELLEERGGVPVLGVLPWLDDLRIPEEDAIALTESEPLDALARAANDSALDIAVIHLPHIANFDDFDPLAREADVRLRYATSVEQLGRPDVIVLPGTKNTLDDLRWLRRSGLGNRIAILRRRGASVVGICGGYQMLGRSLNNPQRLENDCQTADGLGLLDIETSFRANKQTFQVRAEIIDDRIAPGTNGQSLTGYEIHLGHTASSSSWLTRTRLIEGDSVPNQSSLDGARSEDGRVWGCYLHGLFHNDAFRSAWLKSLGAAGAAAPDGRLPFDGNLPAATNAHATIQQELDRLADAVEAGLDINRLEQLIWKAERATANG